VGTSRDDEVGPSGIRIDSRRLTEIRRKLLGWYAVEARDLPWRHTSDPYAILVSEVMLQQTRVETAIPYYERFMRRFPSIEALARAPIDDVLKAWEGLGYYRRAHNLHRAAGEVADRLAGRLPCSAAELTSLPGIGANTAAAVVSIAFGGDEAVLDGNVIRVLSRLFLISGDPGRARTRAMLRETAQRLLSRGEAAAFNQALMDLGARICLSRRPKCSDCPVRAECDADHRGLQSQLPRRRERKALPHVDVVAGVVWKGRPLEMDGRFLLAQRKAEDMLGGLWEFPGGRVEPDESREEALSRELLEELGIEVDVGAHFVDVEHAYTHFRMSLHVYHCRLRSGTPRAIDCAAWAWIEADDLDRYALSTADRQVATRLRSLLSSGA
jgi:A/G-specific adenine glycosylase